MRRQLGLLATAALLAPLTVLAARTLASTPATAASSAATDASGVATAYRTRGSHGGTHVPDAAMAWLCRWVTLGTTITIAA